MRIGLETKNSQHLALTPQMQQSIRVLQIPTVELIQEINSAIEDNPFLEAMPVDSSDRPSEEQDLYSSHFLHPEKKQHGFSEDESLIEQKEAEVTLQRHLLDQLGCLKVSKHDRELVEWLIGSLNEEGLLEEPLKQIAEEAPFEDDREEEDWQHALSLLQSFEPTGVGARSIAEMLVLQIRSPNCPQASNEIKCLATKILQNHMNLLGMKKFPELKKLLHCSEEEIKDAVALISNLNPHPVADWGSKKIDCVIPEVLVSLEDGKWVASLLPDAVQIPRLNDLYAQAFQQTKQQSDAGLWLDKLREARFFINTLYQRATTLKKVASAIVARQQDFFTQGTVCLRPMVLKDIAEDIDIHESTVSRVVNGKFLTSPRGVFELRFFFSSGFNKEGSSQSSQAVKAALKKLIDNENKAKPLSDLKLVELLKEQQFDVARRTVAKYREQMGINPASLRKIPY